MINLEEKIAILKKELETKNQRIERKINENPNARAENKGRLMEIRDNEEILNNEENLRQYAKSELLADLNSILRRLREMKRDDAMLQSKLVNLHITKYGKNENEIVDKEIFDMINGTKYYDKEKISLLRQELIDRMQVGKVYSPEEVKKANEQFVNGEITAEELNEITLNSSIDRNGENLSIDQIQARVLNQAQYRDGKVLESTRQAYSSELEPQDLSKAKGTIKDELTNEQELITEDERE